MHLIDPDFETSFWSRPKTGGGGRGVFRPLTDFFFGGGASVRGKIFGKYRKKFPFSIFSSLSLFLYFCYFFTYFYKIYEFGGGEIDLGTG